MPPAQTGAGRVDWHHVSPTPTSGLLHCVPPLARANQAWFHSAHHITRGTGFAGDHVKIYKKIYRAYDDAYDRAAEKAVGMTHESVACPLVTLPAAAQIVTKYSQPCKTTALQIAQQGLTIERNFLGFIENALKNLRASGEPDRGH